MQTLIYFFDATRNHYEYTLSIIEQRKIVPITEIFNTVI